MLCRPFAWKGGVYLSHWLSLPPSQDRVALAKLDLEHNSLSFVYRFDTLEDELAKLKGLKARTHERSTSTLEQVCYHSKEAQGSLQRLHLSICCLALDA